MLALSPADLCHAVLLRKPFTAEGWLWELKHDGFRAFVRHSKTVELLSRNGRSMANAFPEIAAAIATLPLGVFDGELVVPDSSGRSDFGELQRRSIMKRQATIDQASRESPAALVLFDVLQAGKRDMRKLPLRARKEWLEERVTPRPGLQLMDGIETHGEALFAATAEQDFEGIVGKRFDAPYKSGRQPSWVKVKNPNYSRQDAIIGFRR